MKNNIVKDICNGPVIPAVRTMEDLQYALSQSKIPAVILLFGDINLLPDLIKLGHNAAKIMMIHLDLIEGVGKDKAGIKLLARMGVKVLITTKPYLSRYAHELGLTVIQRIFLLDSESLKTGLLMLKNCKPDALEILPASVPSIVVQTIIKETGLPVFAGGLVYSRKDVEQAIANGVCAVSTSRRELWSM